MTWSRRAFVRLLRAWPFFAKAALTIGKAVADGSDCRDLQAYLIREIEKHKGISPIFIELGGGAWYINESVTSAIFLAGKRAIHLDGQGANVVVKGYTPCFHFIDCENIRIQNLSIEYQADFFLQGVVSFIKTSESMVDILLDKKVFELGDAFVIKAISDYNERTGVIAGVVDDYHSVLKSEVISDCKVRLYLKTTKGIADGMHVILRKSIYDGRIFHFQFSNNIFLDRITLKSGPGMGAVFQMSSNISLSQIRITPKKGMWLSLNADALHFDSCTGSLTIEDSSFSSMGDDGINIHSKFWKVRSRLTSSVLQIEAHADDRFSAAHGSPAGDWVYLLPPDRQTPISRRRIAAVERHTGCINVIFEAPIPAEIIANSHLEICEQPSTRIVNCSFLYNRARGVLVRCDADIRFCTFEGQSEQALLISTDQSFLEGPSPGNVHVSECVFRNIGLGKSKPALEISLLSDETETAKAFVVEKNYFESVQGLVFRVYNCENISFCSNTLEKCYVDAVKIERCVDVNIAKNSSDVETTCYSTSSRKVTMSENVGIRFVEENVR